MRQFLMGLPFVAAAAGGIGPALAEEALPVADPYLFSARKAEGGLTLSGHAPGPEARAALVARAAELGEVTDLLELAAGAPEDWQATVAAALSALEPLTRGTVEIAGQEGTLAGSAASVEALDAAAATLGAAPEIAWQTQLRLALGAETPFSLGAERAAAGPVILQGHAPDEETRARLAEIAEAIGGTAPDGRLILAEPAPIAGWADTAAAALLLLGEMKSGRLEISGPAVTLTGEVVTDPEADAIRAAADPDWELLIAVLDPDPPSRLTISLGQDGGPTATGRLPRDMDAGDLAELLPGVSAGEIETGGNGARDAWRAALTGLAAVMPRLARASITIENGDIAIFGQLREGFIGEEARSALRSIAGPGWSVTFDVTEAPPDAMLAVTTRGGEVEVAGLLPSGLDPAETAALFGVAPGEGLGGGGGGEPALWRAGIDALARLVPLTFALEARMSGTTIEIGGVLRPGHVREEAAAILTDAEARGWQVTLDLAETDVVEGDTRVNIRTGATETLTGGFWMPEIEVEPDPAACTARAGEILAATGIGFVTGSAALSLEAEGPVNLLAALALACLGGDGGAGRLIIGGHTDSVGERRANLDLSLERAGAVLDALAARGIDRGAMVAIGYGPFAPVADNETEEGRAQNRRITFTFIE